MKKPSLKMDGEGIIQHFVGAESEDKSKNDSPSPSRGQDAHEAIHPTDPARPHQELETGTDQRHLYHLILQRSL